jgi:hypothetical protein
VSGLADKYDADTAAAALDRNEVTYAAVMAVIAVAVALEQIADELERLRRRGITTREDRP